ncbi:hypothetical protein WNY37_06055 [Henriciella sp. AS95]|uniref:hypothetical protein n=1 Tax=Henriciella sp. AS95 TaxID=3135782 RepID=UPI0031762D02
MLEAELIRGPMGHDVSPNKVGLDFQTTYDAIGAATEKCKEAFDFYGAQLWTELANAGGRLSAIDQTVDRLPPTAFGRVAPSTHFTALTKEWATYRTQSIPTGYALFKKTMLYAGWKPSHVNSFLVISMRMEEMMFGEAMIAESPPDFSTLDQSDLNERERSVVAMMQEKNEVQSA